MATLLIAIGNSLRRDDGIAQAVLKLMDARPSVDSRRILQLTPEMAENIAACETVIFIDADAGAAQLSIHPVDQPALPAAFTHVSTPAEIVAISRSLYGFAGAGVAVQNSRIRLLARGGTQF
jgi:Ni,Fe-hydrogenase maturation factor